MIKYYNPPDTEGEDYEGGRDEDSLEAFAKTLGPTCSPQHKDKCDEAGLANLEKLLAIPEADRVAELQAIQDKIDAEEKALNDLLQELQAQYHKAMEAFEKAKTDAAPRIKELKSVGTRLPKKEPEPDADDDDDDDSGEEEKD